MSRYIDLDKVEFLKVDGNEEFNHGVDCCVNRLLEAEPIKAVSLDRIKEARKEMKECSYSLSCFNVDVFDEDERVVDLDNVLIIIDKLIAEAEKGGADGN